MGGGLQPNYHDGLVLLEARVHVDLGGRRHLRRVARDYFVGIAIARALHCSATELDELSATIRLAELVDERLEQLRFRGCCIVHEVPRRGWYSILEAHLRDASRTARLGSLARDRAAAFLGLEIAKSIFPVADEQLHVAPRLLRSGPRPHRFEHQF